jgi:hypothetical protein
MGEDVTEDEAQYGNDLVRENPILRRAGAELVTLFVTVASRVPEFAERIKKMGVHLDD